MHGKAPDTACLVAPTAATPSQATRAPQGSFLLQRVVADGELLVVASSVAMRRIGSLHGCQVGSVALVYDGAPTSACVPLLGEPARCGNRRERSTLTAGSTLPQSRGRLIVRLLTKALLSVVVWRAAVRAGLGGRTAMRQGRHRGGRTTVHGGGGTIKSGRRLKAPKAPKGKAGSVGSVLVMD